MHSSLQKIDYAIKKPCYNYTIIPLLSFSQVFVPGLKCKDVILLRENLIQLQEETMPIKYVTLVQKNLLKARV